MTTPENAGSSRRTKQRDLSEAAIGAVVALVRVAELTDPAVAHRSALRAVVAERVFWEYTAPSLDSLDTAALEDSGVAVVIATAALADLDLTSSRPTTPVGPVTHSARSADSLLVGELDGLDAVAKSIDQHRERWDGKGLPAGLAGTNISLAARISAVADSAVGNPTFGLLPSWHQARKRIRRQSGTTLDPSLCRALERVKLDEITVSDPPATVVQALLTKMPHRQLRDQATQSATAIRSAVTSAGQTAELLELFATTALRSVRATEIVILETTATQLNPEPVALVNDGQVPALSLSRFDDLHEFSTQAALRAGTIIAREDAETENLYEMIVPIDVRGDAWGVLIASRRSTDTSFDDHDFETLEHFAGEIADAIAATDHWADMERMALRDQLTGLGNRHLLYRVLDSIFLRPPDERLDTALIMCDVDGLKLVNDNLGHAAGDRLLMDAADALRGAVRDDERTTVCRIGGDEFCMVIDGGALLNAHEITATIERLFARSAGSGPVRSISCGIAFADEVTSRSELLRSADEYQYKTKKERKSAQLDQSETRSADETEYEASDRRAHRE